MKLPPMPKFANETEEAQWWFDHRMELADDMVAAMEQGRTGEGSRARSARLKAEEEQQRLAAAAPVEHTPAS